MFKISIFTVFMSSLLFAEISEASGSYTSPNLPQGASKYVVGKMIFKKVSSSKIFRGCLSCYRKNSSFKGCAALDQCANSSTEVEFAREDIASLKYFIKKRYRVD